MIKFDLFIRTDLHKALAQMSKDAVRFFISAAKSEGYRLKKEMSRYIRSHGRGTWKPYAPLTKKLRKYGAARWFARFTRYEVVSRGNEVFIRVGIFPSRVQPPSREVIRGARLLASGYEFPVTRSYQKYIGWILRHQIGFKREATIRKYIPKLGKHRVKPRPFVEPVIEAEKDKVIQNIRMLWTVRVATGVKIRR